LWIVFFEMSPFFNRIKLSHRFIAKTANEWTTKFFAFVGLLSLFVSFEGIFSDSRDFWYKLLIAVVIIAVVWLVCALIVTMKVGCQKKKKVVEGQNGKGVYVVYGDIFDPSIVNNQKRYIAFAVNRCFDTIVDDNLVGATSVHGLAFNRLYKQGLYTTRSLNTALQGAMKLNPNYVVLSRSEKPAGNLKRYEVGAYANLPIDSKLNYLLLGLTCFDSNLNAHTSKQDYALSIQKMIEMLDMEAQCYPVLMPIIGAGRARADLKEREALEYIIEAFKINQSRITSDVYIVVYESAQNRVSIADL